MKDKPVINFETKRLLVRSLTEGDKEPYMDLRQNTSDFRSMYIKDPAFRESEWENELNGKDDIYMSVFLKESGTFVASASFQNYRKRFIELGFDVVKEYRNQGFGTELLKSLIERANLLFPRAKLKAKTRKNNTICQKLLEENGGILIRKEDAPEVMFYRTVIRLINKKYDGDELENLKQDCIDLIEKGKNSIYVYLIE